MARLLIGLALLCLLGGASGHRHLHHAVFRSHKAAQKGGFTPVFAFPGLETGKPHDDKAPKAAVNFVAETPTRFEFQRACYNFVYKTLQEEPRTRDHPEEVKEPVMKHCAALEKKDCEEWADKLVSVLEQKETEANHQKHRHSARQEVEQRAARKESQHKEHSDKAHHNKHVLHKKEAKKEEEVPEEKKPVAGKQFSPKKVKKTEEDLGTGEEWKPPRAKHHHVALLQEGPPTRYDEWCDQIYERSGGTFDRKVKKPSASDSVPRN